ncbi:uncharacterized protein [Palaemon carinicauda]|uniref:uncharacterized protein n=1 Tax=Palaemon carinicauda TaxID=392227 RepID=UPI0035B69E21
MTGRGREVADMMERRKVQISYVQETRWEGNKDKEIVAGEVVTHQYRLLTVDWDRKRTIRGTEEDKERSRLAKKEAKVVVTQSKQQALDNVYEDLDTKEGKRKIYKIANGRNKAATDISLIKQIKNEDGVVMSSSCDIKGS